MSSAAYEEFREKEHAYSVSKRAFKEARFRDVEYFRTIAQDIWGDRAVVAVSLRDFKEYIHDSFEVRFPNNFELQLSRGNGDSLRWYYVDLPMALNVLEFTTQLVLSDDQLFFLDWSRAFASNIDAFWYGRREQKTLEEFITRMQETCDRVHLQEKPMVKAASKQ